MALRIAVAALLAFEVIPEAWAASGPAAGAAALLGVSAAYFAHRLGIDGDTAGAAGAAALALHGMADGVALAVAGDSALGAAVALHSVPVGLTAWRFGHHHFGPRAATGLLLSAVVGTLLGYGMGGLFVGASWLGLGQAFAAGLLVAAVAHGTPQAR